MMKTAERVLAVVVATTAPNHVHEMREYQRPDDPSITESMEQGDPQTARTTPRRIDFRGSVRPVDTPQIGCSCRFTYDVIRPAYTTTIW